MLKTDEIISLEAVGTEGKPNNNKSFYFTTKNSKKKSFDKLGMNPLKEGMVMGVTGALLLKKRDLISAFFVESHVNIGDSKAAAKTVELLDKYLSLNVDSRPLLKAAEKFESTLKNMMDNAQKSAVQKKRRDLSYLG